MGYHEELEAANKRLEMENRLMGPRVSRCLPQTTNMGNSLRRDSYRPPWAG